MDLARSHAAAWKLGRLTFNYTGEPPRPTGMLIGEAPGPNTDARLPLYPAPTNSACARLLRYADVDPVEWMGRLVRMNLCQRQWSERGAIAGRVRAISYLLDDANYVDGKPLRVLLIGERVSCAWGCWGPFGYVEQLYPGDCTLKIAWIPQASGRNQIYDDRRNQLRARRAVQWVLGDRAKP